MLKRNIKKIFESISGYKIAKYGTGSFFFANKRLTGDLWFFYEMELASIFEKYKVNLVIDVGANRGQFSTHLKGAVKYREGLPHSSQYRRACKLNCVTASRDIASISTRSRCQTHKLDMLDKLIAVSPRTMTQHSVQ